MATRIQVPVGSPLCRVQEVVSSPQACSFMLEMFATAPDSKRHPVSYLEASDLSQLWPETGNKKFPLAVAFHEQRMAFPEARSASCDLSFTLHWQAGLEKVLFTPGAGEGPHCPMPPDVPTWALPGKGAEGTGNG